jgi:hypothetical protein
MAMSFHLLVRSSAPRGDRNRCGYCHRMTAGLSSVHLIRGLEAYDRTKGEIALSEVERIRL